MDRTRPRALVTTPVRGPGLELLRELADLVIDPWIDHQPLRIYNAEQLAERAAAEGATILMVEADRCAGPVFDLPLVAVASTRGDPNNVDIDAATAAGVPGAAGPGPQRRRRGRDRRWHCSSPPPGAWSAPTTMSGRARSTRTGPSPTSASGPGSWPGGRPGSSASVPWGAPCVGASRASACTSSPTTPTRPTPPTASNSSSRSPTWCRCTPRSPRRPQG